MDLMILAAVTAPFIILLWAMIQLNWRIAVYGIALYTPFTGFVVAALHPTPIGALVRDILFTIPLYTAFFLLTGAKNFMRVPLPVIMVFGAFTLLVIFQMGNPGVMNMMMAGIGAKVWLFYIPLILVGAAFLRTEDDLRGILRAIVAAGGVGALIGVIQWMGIAITGDFKGTIEAFYGDYAKAATQNFSTFHYGGGLLYRLPGPFQFNSQYGVFCCYMLFPIFMLLAIDRSPGWRMICWTVLVLVLLAGFTSGARGNFLFMPLILVMIQFFKFKTSGAWQAIMGVGGAMFAAFSVYGIDGGQVASQMGELTTAYASTHAAGGIATAMTRGGFFGTGTGTNTGAARHSLADASYLLTHETAYVESFFGKTLVELGVVGFMLLLVVFIVLMIFCLQTQFSLKDERYRNAAACVTALVAFIVITSFKGWALDTDPLNYFFYLTLGLALGLPHLEAQNAARGIAPVGAPPRARRGAQQPQPLPPRGAGVFPGARPGLAGRYGAMSMRSAAPRTPYEGGRYGYGYGYGRRPEQPPRDDERG